MTVSPTVAVLSRAADQRAAIMNAITPVIGRISPIYGNEVLTATYIEPEQTAGGIFLPDQRIRESVFQGKVGLVLALGVDAFKYKDGYAYFARNKNETDIEYETRVSILTPKVGDWIIYRPVGNIFKCSIKGFACQFVHDSEIKGRVSDPDVIF